MISRIMPLLNELVPVGMAVKGLEKIDPRFKKFFASAAGAGFGIDQAMGYLRSKFSGSGKTQTNMNLRADEQANQALVRQSHERPQAAGNALRTGAALGGAALGGLTGLGLGTVAELSDQQQMEPEQPIDMNAAEDQAMALEQNYNQKAQENGQGIPQPTQDPFLELAKFDVNLASLFEEQIQNGRTPIEAAAIAQNSSKFGKIISSIEKKTKMSFIDIVEKLFGSSQPQQKQPMNREQALGNFRNQIMQKQQESPQQSQQQQGPGQQAMMAMLQKINSRLGQ